jgi:IS30 family transposase
MDNPNYTTDSRKHKHLNFEERMLIQIRLKEGFSPYNIAKELGRARNTVLYEIRRGIVPQIKQRRTVHLYLADAGKATYERNRQNCQRKNQRLMCNTFIAFVCDKVLENHWSLDACYGYAINNRLFLRTEMVCTKTLYNYIDAGLLRVKKLDLPVKVRLNTKPKRNRTHKIKLGRSISERPAHIEARNEFGHWEIDTVIGSKSKGDEVLLTLVERMTRHMITQKISGKGSSAVAEGLVLLKSEYGERFGQIFKTITSDNGLEFSDLSKLEENGETKVYFAHPYTSCERGTNERHNGLLRRFIPKSKRIDGYSLDEIAFVCDWCNSLPRKILGYKTPEELYEIQLDEIYSA